MKKQLLTFAIASLAMASSEAAVVYTFDYDTNGALDGAGGRRYTTFNTGVASFDSATQALVGTNLAATNSNPSGGNPGPGHAYLPTGVSWAPGTVYTIDFLVADRAGQADGAIVEYGLWDSLPADDAGVGGNLGGGPFDAASDSSLGQIGQITIGDLGDGTSAFVSSLSGATASDTSFSFTTGSDVSGLGPMVFFLRSGDDGAATGLRAHWDLISIDATPVPEPASAALVALGAISMLRRRRA